MKSTGEEVRPVKDGKHGVTISETKPVLATPVAQNPLSFLRRVTDDLERQLAAWGLETPWLDRPIASWLSPRLGMGEPIWSPEVELVRHGGKLVVRADVPGTRREDLTVEVEEDHIVLKGERRSEEKEEREGYFRSERSYGSFFRTIPLPPGAKAETAQARLHDGVLEVTIEAPAEAPKGKAIEIK